MIIRTQTSSEYSKIAKAKIGFGHQNTDFFRIFKDSKGRFSVIRTQTTIGYSWIAKVGFRSPEHRLLQSVQG